MKPDNSPQTPPTAAALRQILLRLRQRELDLVERAERIDTRERQHVELLAQRQRELADLEVRVQNQRRKLAALEAETTRAETVICGFSPPGPASPRPPAEPPVILFPRQVTSLVGDLKVALADVADQQRIVVQQHSRLQLVKQAWLNDWQGSLSTLACREYAVGEREVALETRTHELAARERRVQDQSSRLIRREQSLQCWEARLTARQAELRSERARLLALVRSRSLAMRARSDYLVRWQARWERERREELSRHGQHCAAVEVERQNQLRLSEMLRLKLQSVARKERSLLERDYIVRQAEEQLLANDPRPLDAEQELERRLAELKRVVERPLRGLEKKEERLAVVQAELQTLRETLLEEHLRLAEGRADLEAVRRSLSLAHASLDAERQRWRQRLGALRGQRAHLLQRVRDLQEQIERLTFTILQDEQPGSIVRLAA